jgi:hypothetical protein
MPINNVGYRRWNGRKGNSLDRLTAIAGTGLRVSFKSQWIKRMLFVSWLPVLYFAFPFFFFEQFMDGQVGQALKLKAGSEKVTEALREMRSEQVPQEVQPVGVPRELRGVLEIFPKSEVVIRSLTEDDPRVARHTVWCWLLATFLGIFQSGLLVVLIGLVAPPLISRDLRSRAYLMYFSRPIGRLEYLLGKLAIPACYLAIITILPAMTLYVFGVMLSPGLSVVLDTWDIPFRILAASLVLIVPTSLLALMFSSLTYESRFAAFAWLATVALGFGAYRILNLVTLNSINRLDEDGKPIEALDWSFLSLQATVVRVQDLIFGLEPNPASTILFGSILLVLAIVAALILNYRVAAPINA